MLNLKKYVYEIRVKYFIPLKNIDRDFWGTILRNDMEGFNV